VEIVALEELKQIARLCLEEKVALFVLGGGSNLLFDDKGFDGVVVRLGGEFSKIEAEGTSVSAKSGARSSALLDQCVKHGLSGLECLSGVPGTVGGALAGNAGTRENAIGSLVTEVEVLSESFESVVIPKKQLEFGYRRSNLSKRIILGARFSLIKAQKNDILQKTQKLLDYRRETQPQGEWCAGSVFKNPAGNSAAKLIDDCGLKGVSFGGAKISEKHANFIVNSSRASAEDVKELISLARNKVSEKFGIDLDLEIKIVGQ
jgi:UDP-N-acetylmuramate dehydrogenase